MRPGTIARASLIDRLAREDSGPIVSVVAPSGYGKTTLLAQWAARDGHPFAWVSLDERDNDPKVLLSYVAAALNAVQPLGARVFEVLASPVSSVPGAVVPRLGSAFWSMTVPVVLVLDDVHLLHNAECRDALSVLADHVPAGSRLVLAGRDEPPLRVARLRAQGRLLDIGVGDLSLNQAEAAALLRAAEVMLGEDDVAALHRRTEGWAAGLYLAALYLREGGPLGTAAVSFGGDDRLVSEYMESEFLGWISARHRVFLTRTAVLERMCGPLCEAVLAEPGSAAVLAELARSNLLLVPLDRRGYWYRYHHLFRDMLLAELERLEPGLLPVLRRRAAAWCLDQRPAGGSRWSTPWPPGTSMRPPTWWNDSRCRSADKGGSPPFSGGWGGWMSGAGSKGTPWSPCWPRSSTPGWDGRARPIGGPISPTPGTTGTRAGLMTLRSWAGLPWSRAFMCRRGVERMLADADEASHTFATHGIVTAGPALLQGLARTLSGDLAGGDASLEDAVSVGENTGAHEVLAAALSERSLLAMARGEWSRAQALSGQAGTALDQAGIEASYVTPLVCAVQARSALHRGDIPAARQQLVSAQRMRPVLTYAIPHVAIQARIELIHAHLALADVAGARTLMREIDEILKRRPNLGTLVGEARALRTRLSAERTPSCPRGVVPDRRRAARPAHAGHAPVVPGDRRRDVPVAAHRQVPGHVDLPEAGCLLPPPGGHSVPRTGTPRRLRPFREGHALIVFHAISGMPPLPPPDEMAPWPRDSRRSCAGCR